MYCAKATSHCELAMQDLELVTGVHGLACLGAEPESDNSQQGGVGDNFSGKSSVFNIAGVSKGMVRWLVLLHGICIVRMHTCAAVDNTAVHLQASRECASCSGARGKACLRMPRPGACLSACL